MSILQQWGGVMLGHISPEPVAGQGRQPKLWQIGDERKTLEEWVRDRRNCLQLSASAIKTRIWRAERDGRTLSIAALQDPQARFARTTRKNNAWKLDMVIPK
jgi:hypothetical protein